MQMKTRYFPFIIQQAETFAIAHVGLLRFAPRPRPTACGDGGFAASLSRKKGPLEIHECLDQAIIKFSVFVC